MGFDVDACASGNAASWRQRGDAAVAADPELAEFRESCRTPRVGSDVSDDKLLRFLELDPPRLVSTYRYYCEIDGAEVAAANVYGDARWGARRAAVEDGVADRGGVVYGTLDLPGCCGDEDDYGPYRLVFDPAAEPEGSGRRPALVIPHNSAKWYGGPDGELDEALLCGEVARWDERGEVAAERLGPRLGGSARESWPAIVSRSDGDRDLVEVLVRDGERPLDQIDAIRVDAAYFKPRADAYCEALVSDPAIAVELPAGVLLVGRLDSDPSIPLEVVGR